MHRVFELGRVFRNEGLSSRHNPEFTSLELYQAFADYRDMMRLTERILFQAALTAGLFPNKIPYQNVILDFSPPFRELTMMEPVKPYANVDCISYFATRDVCAATRDVCEYYLFS